MQKYSFTCSDGHEVITTKEDVGMMPIFTECPHRKCNQYIRYVDVYKGNEKATYKWVKPQGFIATQDPRIRSDYKNGFLILKPIVG